MNTIYSLFPNPEYKRRMKYKHNATIIVPKQKHQANEQMKRKQHAAKCKQSPVLTRNSIERVFKQIEDIINAIAMHVCNLTSISPERIMCFNSNLE